MRCGGGDGAWTCERHLKTLLFAQFAGLKSLREIVEVLSSRPCALYHVGLRFPKRTTLSDASASRPVAVFRDVAATLMAQLARGPKQEGEELVQLIDTSPIPLRDGRFDWAQADYRCRGLKLHMPYDLRAARPVHFAITSPKVSDLTEGRVMPLEAGTTYVFDKGYTDYGWWKEIVESGALFVTRLKSNAHRRNVRPPDARGEAVLGDQRIRLGHKQPRGGAKNPLFDTDLREVIVFREGKAPLHLITNDHARSAEEIAALYKERWQIELFFKWISQNLKIKTFLGRGENAVRIQIYVALIAYLVVIEAEFVLGGFEAVLDGPAMAFHRYQLFHRRAREAPCGEEGEIAVGDGAADQQAPCPLPGEGAVVFVGLEIGQFEIGPVVQARPFGSFACRQPPPGALGKVLRDLGSGAADGLRFAPGPEHMIGGDTQDVALAPLPSTVSISPVP